LEAVLDRLPLAIALNGAFALVAYLLGTVRPGGAVAGVVLGASVLAFAGWGAFILLGAFFVLGSAATRWGWSVKEKRGVAETHRGARGVTQVMANGAPAAALAVAYGAAGEPAVLMLGYAGALATASADTASSEIGQVYGTRPVSLPGFKAVPIGTPGAISAAGTAGGAAAALVIGLAAAAVAVLPLSAVPVVTVCALLGGFVESLLAGALRGSYGHHILNLLNTCVGAGASMALWSALF
jgi:uncharacterized protein (TIGR00297 family)